MRGVRKEGKEGGREGGGEDMLRGMDNGNLKYYNLRQTDKLKKVFAAHLNSEKNLMSCHIYNSPFPLKGELTYFRQESLRFVSMR